MATKDRAKLKIAITRHRREVCAPVTPKMQLGVAQQREDGIGCRGGETAFRLNTACNHCEEPDCLPSCPTGALYKREEDGIVDVDSTFCVGCRRCEAACPYGAPQYDPVEKIIKKCNCRVDEIDADAGRKLSPQVARRRMGGQGDRPRRDPVAPRQSSAGRPSIGFATLSREVSKHSVAVAVDKRPRQFRAATAPVASSWKKTCLLHLITAQKCIEIRAPTNLL